MTDGRPELYDVRGPQFEIVAFLWGNRNSS